MLGGGLGELRCSVEAGVARECGTNPWESLLAYARLKFLLHSYDLPYLFPSMFHSLWQNFEIAVYYVSKAMSESLLCILP
jgi:hypothetical protein